MVWRCLLSNLNYHHVDICFVNEGMWSERRKSSVCFKSNSGMRFAKSLDSMKSKDCIFNQRDFVLVWDAVWMNCVCYSGSKTQSGGLLIESIRNQRRDWNGLFCGTQGSTNLASWNGCGIVMHFLIRCHSVVNQIHRRFDLPSEINLSVVLSALYVYPKDLCWVGLLRWKYYCHFCYPTSHWSLEGAHDRLCLQTAMENYWCVWTSLENSPCIMP